MEKPRLGTASLPACTGPPKVSKRNETDGDGDDRSASSYLGTYHNLTCRALLERDSPVNKYASRHPTCQISLATRVLRFEGETIIFKTSDS
jgi:hypothetical protein